MTCSCSSVFEAYYEEDIVLYKNGRFNLVVVFDWVALLPLYEIFFFFLCLEVFVFVFAIGNRNDLADIGIHPNITTEAVIFNDDGDVCEFVQLFVNQKKVVARYKVDYTVFWNFETLILRFPMCATRSSLVVGV